jgi:hypothetical protein
MEYWKDFEFGDRLYKISSCGKIFDCSRDSFIAQTPNSDGYMNIKLGIGEKRKTMRVSMVLSF